MLRYAGLLLFTSVFIVGCRQQPLQSVPSTSTNSSSDESATGRQAKLEAADKLDGKADHVIGKCYVCALGMDGKPEHSAEFQGYTVHLCSESCCNYFSEHPEEIVEETATPKPSAQ